GRSGSGAGDVGGDGQPDLFAGAVWANTGTWKALGAAALFSGRTGQILWRFNGLEHDEQFGTSVSMVDDVDGDGVIDLLVGAPGRKVNGLYRAGSVELYSGATGGLIYRLDGGNPSGWFGTAVAATGDLDADGRGDFVVGEPTAIRSAGNVEGQGAVHVFSGAAGTTLWDAGGTWRSGFGEAVCGVGDVDLDGIPDIGVGASGWSKPQAAPWGSAFVLSGATGRIIHHFGGQPVWERKNWDFRPHFGYSVAGVGDANGDGCPDILVGEPWASPRRMAFRGSAKLFSGLDGKLLHRFDGDKDDVRFGMSVAGAGDVNRDGLADLVVGSQDSFQAGEFRSGSVSVFTLLPYLIPDTTKLAARLGATVQLDLDFPISEAGQAYVVLASLAGTGPTTLAGLTVPLSSDRLLRRMAGGWSPPLLRNGKGALGPAGDARATLHGHSALAPLIGSRLYLAAASYHAGTGTGRLSSIARWIEIVP
ncbi:MAG: FG-GAP repeat protein, partial [Planctomycetes bacterium]|nr:FG-GAP repeat protein [Planctomycetota bacterium]